MKTIFQNGILYTGSEVLKEHALITEDGTITEILPAAAGLEMDLPSAAPIGLPTGAPSNPTTGAQMIDLQGGHLAPAFIDLQIYGAYGLLFADHPSVEAISATYRYCKEGGAAYFQPTMGTQTDALMDAAIDAVAAYQEQGLPGVLGLHLEGPYINPLKRGAHVEAYIQKPETGKLRALLERGGKHLSMMTLAPECCLPEIIARLKAAGVVLSAGHSNATYEEALDGFSQGIPAATHLYNAMSVLSHRAPGMVGALLDVTSPDGQHPAPMVSIVADGYHVSFPAIRIAKQLLKDRLFLITDAVTASNDGAYPHQLQGDKYVLPDGTLSGSALTMMSAVRNCVEKAGIPLDEAIRMASLYPARLMGVDHRLGTLSPGMEAALVWFDKDYSVKQVFTR